MDQFSGSRSLSTDRSYPVGYFAEPEDRRAFVGSVDPQSVGVARGGAMPMTEHIVITARPAEFRQHVVASYTGQRLQNGLFVALQKAPINELTVSGSFEIVDKPPAVDVAAD